MGIRRDISSPVQRCGRLCVTATLFHTGVKIAARATALLLLPHRADHGEYRDIAVVPTGAQPLSAKVSDRHAAAKMEERRIRTDGKSAGVQVAQLCLDCGWYLSSHMLFNHLADRRRDLGPILYRK
jgi:hypothetical protein